VNAARPSVPGPSELRLVEWKASWQEEHLRWVCAFANAEGGVLVIGRDDRGDMVGVDNAEQLLEEIPNRVRDLLGIVVTVRLQRAASKALLEVIVAPSPAPISYRGEFHVRSGNHLQQLTGATLAAFLQRKLGGHWDGAPVPGVTVEDLEPLAFKRFAKRAANGKRMPADTLSASPQELIEQLRLTEAGMLKGAALLLFHEDAERWFTGAYVKIGMFREGFGVVYHDEFHGDLFRQLADSGDTLLTKYLMGGIGYYPIPPDALRDAVIQALIHKDYTSGAPIQIRVYKDRLVIWNPGQLPRNWTAERLLQEYSPEPQNPDLAQVFFHASLIDAKGQGYRRIVDACREVGTALPRITHDGAGLTVEWAWGPRAGRP
jgi:ATP-dependent DNA helicase RecG